MSGIVQSTSDSDPYWRGFEQGQVHLPFCAECGLAHLPPGPFCPFCFSDDLDWRAASGRAVLSSWVVVHKRYFADFEPPYVVGEVQLEEGPRLTVLIGHEVVQHLRMGLVGQIEFTIAPNGLNLPHFVSIEPCV